MNPILASLLTDLIVAGPLVCGLVAAFLARKVFPDSWGTCVLIGIIAAVVVGFVIRPLHRNNNPNAYPIDPEVLKIGPREGGSNPLQDHLNRTR